MAAMESETRGASRANESKGRGGWYRWYRCGTGSGTGEPSTQVGADSVVIVGGTGGTGKLHLKNKTQQ